MFGCEVIIVCVQAFLLNEDLGDSLDSVEALLKKHEDFEKSLSAQEEKITVSTCPSHNHRSRIRFHSSNLKLNH